MVAVSSSRIVPVAVVFVNVVFVVVALVGSPNVTVNCSSGSITVSPLTLIVTVLEVSPAKNVTVWEGKVPPKSLAFAELALVTSTCAVISTDVSPDLVTVKVKGVKPTSPSFCTLVAGAIAKLVGPV